MRKIIFTVLGGMRGPSERRDDDNGGVQHQQPPATATGPHVQMVRRAMIVAVLSLCCAMMAVAQQSWALGERRPEPPATVGVPPMVMDRWFAVATASGSSTGRMVSVVVVVVVVRPVTAAGRPAVVVASVRPRRRSRRSIIFHSPVLRRSPAHLSFPVAEHGPPPPRPPVIVAVTYHSHRPGSGDLWTRDSQRRHLAGASSRVYNYSP